ncbi:MAG: hypothetical protein COW84_00975 [Gammaproteobacteria bacterium CG22_combo_CG10-13_8_21_14_all_40_8]|nr:MAG: hypothetical protein COW84_00975 [Gammaproteobacteria bacterium CG22_combo_CG10-13_8_21_14_all_40_8]
MDTGEENYKVDDGKKCIFSAYIPVIPENTGFQSLGGKSDEGVARREWLVINKSDKVSALERRPVGNAELVF